ncbi:MAG: hypothetical protein IKY83_02375 [Proteobacteria bacterium]|nr:hypothetical protein [Pseudomonadota bacterium]
MADFRVRLLCLALGVFAFSCESKEPPKVPTPDVVVEPETAGAEALPARLPAPPGEAGPILIRMENAFPSQIFASASTEDNIALGLQSDARDISLCTKTELPVCFRGFALVSARMNPNQPKSVVLYESDTQSGSRIDDVAAAGSKFVFALNEGRYVGDTPEARLVVVDENASILRNILISSAEMHISQTVLRPWGDAQVLVCFSFEPVSGKPGIKCSAFDPETGKESAVATVQTKDPVRAFDVGVSEGRALVAWNESGYEKLVYLDSPGDSLELGIATSARPSVAAGLNEFAVAWQGDDALIHVERVPFKVGLKSLERKSLLLGGLDYRTIGSLVAVSDGYVFAFRHQNTQQLALISTSFDEWHLVEHSDSWRMMSGYASLDIQDAHTGKIIWQTVESLIGTK